MVFEERREILKLFIAVIAGFAAGNLTNNIFGDPLSVLLVSAAAIVIVYYILSFAGSFFPGSRKGND